MIAWVESLQRLRVLREVATRGSFTSAAQALAMSQPSVSQHMSSLEREMGTLLVERSSTGVRLTAAGEVALRHGLRILKTADDARREIASLTSGVHAPLRVAAFGTACTVLLPAAAAALQRHQPGITFDFEECDVDDAVGKVRHGSADLAIAFDYASHPFERHGLHVDHLGDDPIALVLAERHPASREPVVAIDRLVDEPWISGTGFGCLESLRTVCGAAGFAPRIALNSNRYPTTLALVAEGHGMALVPRTALQNPPPGVAVALLRPSAPPRRLWAVSQSERTGPIGDLIDALARTVHERTR